jgi:hypothetical protein
MKRTMPLCLNRPLRAALLAACAAACATAPAAPPVAPPTTPPVAPPAAMPAVTIEVPDGNELLVRLRARGVQIYSCAAGKDGKPAWAFQAPRAELFDATGAAAGHHSAGPTWSWDDGSEVVGEVVQRTPAVGSNIPWLLLRVKSSKLTSPYGEITFVQRMETDGGAAPAGGCDAEHLGAEAQVSYVAAYLFWGRR